MAKELHVGSLTTTPENKISFFTLLKTESLKRNIQEVCAVLRNDNRKRETIIDIGERALGIRINSEQIDVKYYIPDDRDAFFAKKFGFTILPVGYISFKDGEGVKAWIGPTLVPVGHPLYNKTESNNSIHVASEKAEDQGGKGFSYYVRLRVKDQASILAKVSEEFGNREVSIREMRQPEAEVGSNETDMAFLLWPCQEKNLQSALSAIAGLSDIVVRINPPLKAFSKNK